MSSCKADPRSFLKLLLLTMSQVEEGGVGALNIVISGDISLDSRQTDKRKRTSESGDQDKDPNSRYKCRFCGKVFPKSQSLGGHMNRHRKDKEVEQLSQAYRLLESSDPRHLIQRGQTRDFRSTAPYSFTSDLTGLRTHQQSNFYPASTLNWIPGASQSTPYGPDTDIKNPNYVKPEYWTSAVNQSTPPYENMFNIPFRTSQGRNQDTMPGILYERNPDQQHQIFPCDPAKTSRVWPSLGAEGMQLNYLQKQAGESTNVVIDHPFSLPFQSPYSYTLQPRVPGVEELQQFNLLSSISAGFQSPTSIMPADFPKAFGTSSDVQSFPCNIYSGMNSIDFMPNEAEEKMPGQSQNHQGQGILYETNPDQHQIFPYPFSPPFQSPYNYTLQPGAPGSEEFQQFNLISSISAGFQLPSPNYIMPADFPKAFGTSPDVQSFPCNIYSELNSIDFIPNEAEEKCQVHLKTIKHQEFPS